MPCHELDRTKCVEQSSSLAATDKPDLLEAMKPLIAPALGASTGSLLSKFQLRQPTMRPYLLLAAADLAFVAIKDGDTIREIFKTFHDEGFNDATMKKIESKFITVGRDAGGFAAMGTLAGARSAARLGANARALAPGLDAVGTATNAAGEVTPAVLGRFGGQKFVFANSERVAQNGTQILFSSAEARTFVPFLGRNGVSVSQVDAANLRSLRVGEPADLDMHARKFPLMLPRTDLLAVSRQDGQLSLKAFQAKLESDGTISVAGKGAKHINADHSVILDPRNQTIVGLGTRENGRFVVQSLPLPQLELRT